MKLLLRSLLLACAPALCVSYQVNAVHSDSSTKPMAADAVPSFEVASIHPNDTPGRTVVDQTGLIGKYDFDVTFMPDETTFGGRFRASAESISNAV